MTKSYGFKAPIQTPDNFVLGGLGLSKRVLNEERDWLMYVPVGELQKRTFETQNCVAFGTCNGIEVLMNRLKIQEPNWSDRFLGITANTSPYEGNDPNTVAQAVRHYGLVPEVMLPFGGTTPEEYFTPKPPTKELSAEGERWLGKYKFGHEYVWTGNPSLEERQNRLLEALQYSPVGIAVYAWERRADGLYVRPEGSQPNHWCLLLAGERGKPWLVMDSYADDDFIKELEWDYLFEYPKLYTIDVLPAQKKRGFWQRLREWLW